MIGSVDLCGEDLICLLLSGLALAGPKNPGPAASAAEIPALAKLLEKAGWEPTPELSGVFKTGSIFQQDGATHSLMVRSCFDAEEVQDTYTSAEVVTQLQAGVRVKFGLGSVKGSGELIKKVKFGTPVHATLERLAMFPTEGCEKLLARVSTADLESMYAVQEVLTAEIAEQTCGRLDATGKFVGLGAAEAELSMACRQESLEPVAVAYRVVPLVDLVGDRPQLVAVEAGRDACAWGTIETVSSSMTKLTVNGQTMNAKGEESRNQVLEMMHNCGHGKAAPEFEKWRSNRRTTNIACATVFGCWPFAIGIMSAQVAKKSREEMEQILLTGLNKDERKAAEKAARKAARR